MPRYHSGRYHEYGSSLPKIFHLGGNKFGLKLPPSDAKTFKGRAFLLSIHARYISSQKAFIFTEDKMPFILEFCEKQFHYKPSLDEENRREKYENLAPVATVINFAALFLQLTGVDAAKATKEEIKAAYRKAAIKYHPDRGGDSAKMADLNIAYKELQK